MTTTLQLNLRGILTTNHSPEKSTNPVGDFFTDAVTAVTDFFRYITGFFNREFPPEDRDEQIHHWLDVAKPYLIVAVVLIVCICCLPCLFRCIAAILIGCFNVVRSILIGCFNVVRSFFRFIGRCLCCGRRWMKAPGRRPSMRMSRDAFEANPKGYFRDLRGKSNNFVY
ncbi:hypothetical protein OSB04_009171 [Centaurea solstitialis]|uniref:Uncharacterized protein n=1 Tax=Centaurea solstitialis TaxID=347529 RepID=A0AA38TYQ2_9ASTR|nr:hypothetical protein OSB04_009171 [Centaurea solstitialis]